ncbi:MAG: sterol desaturase family protein [Cytophagaceae bacterium]|jgi:sterol desaturase/sphingolipid hydroxylase (fatty acid hydroxylase superfamily)|nr:sterol desaturase family protein [Cytophagaceae bacterium]
MNWDFTVGKLTFEQMMTQYKSAPQLLMYASPAMLFFVFLEYFYTKKKNMDSYKDKRVLWSSIMVGAGYLIVSFLLSLVTFKLVWAVYYYLCPPQIVMAPSWWSFILCFVFYDFWRYWAHRLAHEQRFWWASHITHHSSDYYNLTVSFRLCWVDQVKLVFFLPVVLVGFDPLQFFLAHQIAVLYQFWQHTEVIKQLPAWFEWFFVTPTNHRVHHGKNEAFIDKNYGSTFIIWDRLFGTYQEPTERPVFGVKQPIRSLNPVYLVFHEYVDWLRDLKHAKTWKDRWKATFGRPGDYEGAEKF